MTGKWKSKVCGGCGACYHASKHTGGGQTSVPLCVRVPSGRKHKEVNRGSAFGKGI